MRIGLIGINRYAKYLNFACDLHAYAFQQLLRQRGYDATFLDYRPVYCAGFDMRDPAPYAERRYREALTRKASASTLATLADLAMGFRSASEERVRRYEKFEGFVSQRLTFTDEVYDSDLLEIQDPGFDCYICVTDVIWQPVPTYGFDRGFLLGSKAFEGKAKIAYAASRGAAPDFDGPLEEEFFGYLADMDAISVRERDFSEYIESSSDLLAPTVLDPVLLHDRGFWEQISAPPREQGFVLLYYVMERSADTIAMAVAYAKLHDLTLVELSDRPFRHGKVTDPDVRHVSRYDVGMEEWLGYIEHAEAVFTNAFHGCCFSLMFETPFFVGHRKGPKVPAFLAAFGLQDRQLKPDDDAADLPQEIDFRPARSALARLRQESLGFLSSALETAAAKVAAGSVGTSGGSRARHELRYPLRFHSGAGAPELAPARVWGEGVDVKRLGGGVLEYAFPGARFANSGAAVPPASRFVRPGMRLAGWTIRFRVDNRWFWHLADGRIIPGTAAGDEVTAEKTVLAEGMPVPHLSVNHVGVVVLVAQWEPDRSVLARLRASRRWRRAAA